MCGGAVVVAVVVVVVAIFYFAATSNNNHSNKDNLLFFQTTATTTTATTTTKRQDQEDDDPSDPRENYTFELFTGDDGTFSMVDKDADGFWSAAEFNHYYRRTYVVDQLMEVLAPLLDKDKDGFIDQTEWLSQVMNYAETFPRGEFNTTTRRDYETVESVTKALPWWDTVFRRQDRIAMEKELQSSDSSTEETGKRAALPIFMADDSQHSEL